MRALVTGASGFLGGALARLLVQRGAEVVALARPSSRLRHLDDLPIELKVGELTARQSLVHAVTGCTHIFHCAACSTDWAPWRTYLDANVTGTENLLHAAAASGQVQRFLHVSTTDVYGYPRVPGDESTALKQTELPYNRSKVLGEHAVWAAADRGLPVTVVRPATIYGPRGKDFTVEVSKLLRQRLMATVDGGIAEGGFIYVDDVAEAMIAAATNPAALGSAYNLSGGSNATWAQYLSVFAAALGCKTPWINLSFDQALGLAAMFEAPHRWGLAGKPLLTKHAVYLLGRSQEFAETKARTELGWVPKVSLHEGIARSVEWLRRSTQA